MSGSWQTPQPPASNAWSIKERYILQSAIRAARNSLSSLRPSNRDIAEKAYPHLLRAKDDGLGARVVIPLTLAGYMNEAKKWPTAMLEPVSQEELVSAFPNEAERRWFLQKIQEYFPVPGGSMQVSSAPPPQQLSTSAEAYGGGSSQVATPQFATEVVRHFAYGTGTGYFDDERPGGIGRELPRWPKPKYGKLDAVETSSGSAVQITEYDPPIDQGYQGPPCAYDDREGFGLIMFRKENAEPEYRFYPKSSHPFSYIVDLEEIDAKGLLTENSSKFYFDKFHEGKLRAAQVSEIEM
ncbi:hypothetical protein HYFRA_00011686 [Hymenoscyphus fraxineus]|uniref:Uncharacterized protein n=1 Tax=Hymenoscyphus fraxineus TaxID=746836 RepID=A0A9N9L1F2_9HELO|nr:hypothetical protein HYFRA_00011686 [Hymenoscyphus fraxineus]